jgi:PilZ domain-containing protein
MNICMSGDNEMAALTGLFGAEAERRAALRHAVMLGTHGEQRRALRLLTTAQAVVLMDGERHIGLVRDLSSTGLFVYSDFTPELGTELKLTIRLSRDKNKTAVFLCSGNVVRVEASNKGVAVGIAVRLDDQGELTAETV